MKILNVPVLENLPALKLICNYIRHALDEAETHLLHHWLSESEENQQLFLELTEMDSVRVV
ncbi:MAG: hypothetical protein QM764_20605 [Chitinophagaceae bacterium]